MIQVENSREFRLLYIREKEYIHNIFLNDRIKKNKQYLLLETIFALLTFVVVVALTLLFERLPESIRNIAYILGCLSICSHIYCSISREKTNIDTSSLEILTDCYIENTYNSINDTTLIVGTPLSNKVKINLESSITFSSDERQCNIIKFNQGNKWKYVLNIVDNNKIYEII